MPRYVKGARITDPVEALRLILDGRVIFWNHKPQNHGWLQNMRLSALVGAVRKGILYYAIDSRETQ